MFHYLTIKLQEIKLFLNIRKQIGDVYSFENANNRRDCTKKLQVNYKL